MSLHANFTIIFIYNIEESHNELNLTEQQKEQVFRILNNDIRRDILRQLKNGPQSYTQILDTQQIESGHLAYHLRNMEPLIEKTPLGPYALTELGEAAYAILEEETPEKSPQIPFNRVFLVAILIIVIVTASFFSYNQYQTEKARTQRIDELKEDSQDHLDRTLKLVYKVYENWAVDRATWTELVLELVQLSENLEELTQIDESIDYTNQSEVVSFFSDEFVAVMKNTDETFPSLTLEKRHLIRELQMLLLEIDSMLSN